MPEGNPYPGLRPFEQRDSRVFFGRDDQIDALLDRLDVDRFLAVVGSSASGKSSLIRAGLLPALYGGHLSAAGSRWRVALMRPGGAAISALAEALDAAGVLGRDAAQPVRIGIARAALEEGELGLVALVRDARLAIDENLLLVVDQFEELFRFRHDRDDGPAFVKLLLAAAAQREVPVYVLITMRSDFLGEASQFRDLPEAISAGLFLVPRLTRVQLREAISDPAAIAGGEIAPILVNQLLNEIGDSPDQLPVLQHALMRTWDIAHANGLGGTSIGLSEFAATGGLVEALSVHGDIVYESLEPRVQLVAEKIFRALTDRTSDNRGTRRPASLAELCAVTGASRADATAAIDAFRAPGVSFLMPPSHITLDDATVIDISHESLMRVWRRLEEWVDDEARSARIYRRIADAADLHERGAGALLIDPALTVDLAWRERHAPTAAWAQRYVPGSYDRAMAFLDQSAEARSRQVAAAGSARRRRAVTATGVSFALLLTVLSLVALVALQQQRGEIFAEQSTALARDAQAAIDRGDPVTGALIALAALPASLANPDRPYTREAGDALARAYASVREKRDLTGHTGAIFRIAISPDGRRVVAPSTDGTARIWDVATGKLLHVLNGPAGTYMPSASWSPDGRRFITTSGNGTAQTYDAMTYRKLALFGTDSDYITTAVISNDERFMLTSSFDGDARIWDAATGKLLRILHGKGDTSLWCAAFSPDGRFIATASGDGYARIWDARSGRQLYAARFAGNVDWIAYAPDGKRLVTAITDHTVRVFDAPSLKQRLVIRRDEAISYSATFSHDGRRIVIGSHDTNAEVRDAQSGKRLFVLGGSDGFVWGAFFSPDDRLIATGSADGVARLWDARTRAPRLSFVANAAGLTDAEYVSGGQTIVTADGDGVARVWNVSTGKKLREFRGCRRSLNSAAVSPDGRRLAAGCGRRVLLWDVRTGRLQHVLRGPTDGVTSVVWLPDGRRVAAGSIDTHVRVWNATTGRLVLTLTGPKWQVYCVAVSHDGRYVAGGANTGTITVWDARSGATRIVLKQHDTTLTSVNFSPDDTRLLTSSDDGHAREWDAKTGSVLAILNGHASTLTSSAFSPDGTQLVTGAMDGTVHVWDAEGGEPLFDFDAGVSSVASTVFSPDGRQILTASQDGVVRFWQVPKVPACQDLIDTMRRTMPRELRPDQRQEESIASERRSPLTSVFMGGASCSQHAFI